MSVFGVFLLRIFVHSNWILNPNAGQKNTEYGHFSRSDAVLQIDRFLETPPKKLAKSLPEPFFKVAPVALFDATYVVIIYTTAEDRLNY